VPRLIELQAFPSLFGFQWLLLGCMRKAFPAIPGNGLRHSEGSRTSSISKSCGGPSWPVLLENVILLEIGLRSRKHGSISPRPVDARHSPDLPDKNKKARGNCFMNGTDAGVRIERIYNRVIFDELRAGRIKTSFNFQDDLDVTWVGHPSCYFRIGKHSLPFLKTKHTTPAFFADEFPAGETPGDYVLKPLYSFAGLGVEMEPTREKIEKLAKPRDWILQKKVSYAEFVATPDGPRSKAEIRMMFVWPEEEPDPILVNNLVRMSQGKMMGVDFNKDKTWVGSSSALHKG
jgi:hypothetical protein